jgi:hypothetical protein
MALKKNTNIIRFKLNMSCNFDKIVLRMNYEFKLNTKFIEGVGNVEFICCERHWE